MFDCYQRYLVQVTREGANWDAEFVDIKYKYAVKILDEPNIKERFIYYDFGKSIEKDPDQPIFDKYFWVKAYSDEAFEYAKLNVVEGRLPENSREIVLSQEKNFGKNIGDTLKITLEGKIREFVVVGKTEYLEEDTRDLDDFRTGVVTYLDEKLVTDETLVSARILTRNVKKIEETTKNIAEKFNIYDIKNKERITNNSSNESSLFKEMKELEKQDFSCWRL